MRHRTSAGKMRKIVSHHICFEYFNLNKDFVEIFSKIYEKLLKCTTKLIIFQKF